MVSLSGKKPLCRIFHHLAANHEQLSNSTQVLGDPVVQSFSKTYEIIDDGRQAITKIDETELNSARSMKPRHRYKFLITPSNGASSPNGNSVLSHAQQSKLQLPNGNFARSSAFLPPQTQLNSIGQHRHNVDNMRRANLAGFFQKLADFGGFRRGFLPKSTARTVESPALSVDTGGQSSHSLVGGISRLLKFKHGHYSDMYNRLDVHEPMITKRPIERIEESIERAMHPMS